MEKIYIREKYMCNSIDRFLKPEFIYVIVDEFKYNIGDYIFKDDIISYNNYCPVSGYVRGYIHKYFDNKLCNCLVVENDYKEKCRYNRYSVFDRDSFIYSLMVNGLIDLYDKYDIKCLVINAIDVEPYIFSKRAYINNYALEILSVIDNIMNILGISRSLLVVSSNFSCYNIDNYVGTYPGIRIIKCSDFYPIGNSRILLKEVFNITYDKTSLEKKIYLIDLLSLIDIKSLIKKNIISDEKIIMIGGNGVKNCVIRVKVGTSFKDIISYLGGYKSDCIVYIGGLFTGKRVVNDDFVITRSINSIFITKRKIINEKECILCGKCNMICPVNLNPLLIMKNIDDSNKLKKLGIDKCISCGLCYYICPSYIDFKGYIDKGKGDIFYG